MAEHITRDYSAHKKSVVRPYDEYVKVELFSFDPTYTKTYLPEKKTLKAVKNAEKTSWKSWACYKSTGVRDMLFDVVYNVKSYGNYRIDFLYEQNNYIHGDKKKDTGKNLVGHGKIVNGSKVLYDRKIKFEGENNVIKRKVNIKSNNSIFIKRIVQKIQK